MNFEFTDDHKEGLIAILGSIGVQIEIGHIKEEKIDDNSIELSIDHVDLEGLLNAYEEDSVVWFMAGKVVVYHSYDRDQPDDAEPIYSEPAHRSFWDAAQELGLIFAGQRIENARERLVHKDMPRLVEWSNKDFLAFVEEQGLDERLV